MPKKPTTHKTTGQYAIKCSGTVKREYKVKFIFKLMNFICAVISLSWFFEGWRQVNANPTVPYFLLLTAGTILTLLFLAIHSYWTYVDEKRKGTLRKRIGLFEKIYARSVVTGAGVDVVSVSVTDVDMGEK